MRIFYCVRSLEAVPSCMYNIRMLHDAGYEVVAVIGRNTPTLEKVLAQEKIPYINSDSDKHRNKYIDHFKLNKDYKKNLRKALTEYKNGDLICLGTGDSALVARRLIKNKNAVLFLKELHETPWYYPLILKKIARGAAGVVCCERNRSRVLKFRWGLDKLPYTLSNKPYGYEVSPRTVPSSEQTKTLVKQLEGRETIVYQARRIHFTSELINLAEALKRINNNYLLVLIGDVINPADKELLGAIYPHILWTGHISAPLHLEITSYAKLGIAVYGETSLNNLFCAPNKTFEYAAFGIPTVCNDVPGLVETIGMSRAGMCVDWGNVDAIKNAVTKVFDNYEFYSDNARAFFKSEDNKTRLQSIIEDIRRKIH